MELEFVDKEITTYGGLSILKQMMNKSGFLDKLEHLPLPVQVSNRGYSINQLFVQFMAGVWCGANRFSQLDIIRIWTQVSKECLVGIRCLIIRLFNAILRRSIWRTRPKAVRKQLSLFEDDYELNGYRYTCYVTTLKLYAPDVWRLHKGRANCENRIIELKYDYGLDKMNQDGFDGTEARLLLMTIAYNFMSLFKRSLSMIRCETGYLLYDIKCLQFRHI